MKIEAAEFPDRLSVGVERKGRFRRNLFFDGASGKIALLLNETRKPKNHLLKSEAGKGGQQCSFEDVNFLDV